MRVQSHIALSAVVATVLYVVFRLPLLALGAFFSGFVVDVDHVLDYVLTHGFKLDIRYFFHSFHTGQFSRVFIFLHAWEWIPLLVGIAWVTGWNHFLIGIAIGYSQHVITDHLFNASRPLTYFIVWRWRKGFEYDVAFANETQGHWDGVPRR